MTGPPVIVAMGVAGSGKTTLGRALAMRLAVPFAEGDDLHPAANVAKMTRGVPLDDADRAPWLDAVAEWIAAHLDGGGVISCSALKRSYRDRLRGGDGGRVRFVLLEVDGATLLTRLMARQGHFMPPSLLASQLATLELPAGEPDTLVLDGTADAAREVEAMARWLGG